MAAIAPWPRVSSPPLNKLRRRPPYVVSQHASSTTPILPPCDEPLKLEQVQAMRWGMDVQIEKVMLKSQINLLNWNRVLLDIKELNLAFDENEFEREGGEITWNTEADRQFETDPGREGVESEVPANLEKAYEIAAAIYQLPKVEFVGWRTDIELDKMKHSISANDQLPRVGTVTKGKAPVKTQEQIEHASQEQIAIRSIKEIKKWLNLDHWTDEDVKRWQNAMRAKIAQRAASNKVLDHSQAESSANYPLFKLIVDDENVRRLVESAEYRERRMAAEAQRIVATPVFASAQAEAIATPPLIKSTNGEEDAQRFAQIEEYWKRRGRLRQQYKAEADKVLGPKAPVPPFQGEDKTHTPASLGAVASQPIGSRQPVGAPQQVGTARPVTPPKRVDTPRPVSTFRPVSPPQAVGASKPIGRSQPVPGKCTIRGGPRSHAISTPHLKLPQPCVQDPFEGIYPHSSRMLDPRIDTTPKTPEQEAAEIDEEIEDYRMALQARKEELAADANGQIDGGRLGERTEIAAQKWKEQEARLAAEIELRVQQYREMCVATRQWEKGITGLKGLGEEAQKGLPFLGCDEAEKIRRAGASKVRREKFYASFKNDVACGADSINPTPEELVAYEDYEREMTEDYEAEIAAGSEPGVAAKKAAKKQAKRQAAVYDGIEAQIRKAQEAREKKAAEMAKIKEERALERGAAEATGGKKAKKMQKKGKSGGRRHKK